MGRECGKEVFGKVRSGGGGGQDDVAMFGRM